MTANKLLENSLDTLAAKLGELTADHASELQGICDVLATITSRGMEPADFRRNLKELAEAVIHVRTRPNSPSRFRELPVPPYDLWLPFKAEDSTTTDSEEMFEAMKIFNHKVTALALLNACAADARPQAQPQTSSREDSGAGARQTEDS